MRYDISKHSVPKISMLSKGIKCIKILLSQASKDRLNPHFLMLFALFGNNMLFVNSTPKPHLESVLWANGMPRCRN
jgi:hypothetical protein